MESDERINVVIIGSGNVASALAPALDRLDDVVVTAVCSPTVGNAQALASKLQSAKVMTDVREVPVDADLYLISVKDNAVAEVATKLHGLNHLAVVAHTSGSVDADVLAAATADYGVFYPLQTFSKDVAVDISQVPMFIEGATDRGRKLLIDLARKISNRVYEADSALRSKMHTAAVFACNFVNHLWAVADDILHREANLDISVLQPLITETMRKAQLKSPAEVQTGPAVRGDELVMLKHLQMLTVDEAELYKHLSQHIIDYYKEK